MPRTTQQKIAEAEAKLQRLKIKARKERTRKMIVAGASIANFYTNTANPAEQKMILDILEAGASGSDKGLIAEFIADLKEG